MKYARIGSLTVLWLHEMAAAFEAAALQRFSGYILSPLDSVNHRNLQTKKVNFYNFSLDQINQHNGRALFSPKKRPLSQYNFYVGSFSRTKAVTKH